MHIVEDTRAEGEAIRDLRSHRILQVESHGPPSSPSVSGQESRQKDEWDKQMEEDVKAGKLDDLLEDVERRYREGKATRLS